MKRRRSTRRKARKRIRKRTSSKAAKKIRKMGKRELNMYKKLLLEERERITGEIQHIANDTLKKSQRDAAGDISAYTYHMADVATDSYDREFSLGIASNEREILYDINEALKRIEDNNYGSCLECGRLIIKRRLKAVPHAKYCIKCQNTLEHREGTP